MNNVKHLTDAGSASRIYTVDLAAPVCSVSEQRRASGTGQVGYTHKDLERVYKLNRVKVCVPKTRPYKSRIKTEITCYI